MDAREAVNRAREYLVELFDGEDIYQIGLEEVDFDDKTNEWSVTVGFTRTWDRTAYLMSPHKNPEPRSYKVIRIHDSDGEVRSLRDRGLPASRHLVAPTGYFIDANLLVLLVVGSTDRDLIPKHRRLRVFAKEDYDLLIRFITQVDRVYVTPNTLTETSNLLAQHADPELSLFFDRSASSSMRARR